MYKIKITDPDKFYAADYIDTSGIRFYHSDSDSYSGSIEIDGKCITGEFSATDFRDEYGFIFIPERVTQVISRGNIDPDHVIAE